MGKKFVIVRLTTQRFLHCPAIKERIFQDLNEGNPCQAEK
ncbi:hypothetical protein B14911_17105 [Bacillus sp. NRRL B-14911]|nr:hypothetical protein B14911_17105 [Bacillus sp. NRRL B-14911]